MEKRLTGYRQEQNRGWGGPQGPPQGQYGYGQQQQGGYYPPQQGGVSLFLCSHLSLHPHALRRALARLK